MEANEKSIQKTLNKYYYLITSLGLGSSVLSFALSFIIKNQVWTSILQVIGSLMAGALVSGLLQIKVLGDFNKQDIKIALQPDLSNLENVLLNQIQGIVPEITKKTVESVETIKEKVAVATDFMLDGIGVLSGATESGIINIFPNRYTSISGTSVIQEISRELLSEKNSIKVMGISLGDFFLDRGVLHNVFLQTLEKEKNRECP